MATFVAPSPKFTAERSTSSSSLCSLSQVNQTNTMTGPISGVCRSFIVSGFYVAEIGARRKAHIQGRLSSIN